MSKVRVHDGIVNIYMSPMFFMTAHMAPYGFRRRTYNPNRISPFMRGSIPFGVENIKCHPVSGRWVVLYGYNYAFKLFL